MATTPSKTRRWPRQGRYGVNGASCAHMRIEKGARLGTSYSTSGKVRQRMRRRASRGGPWSQPRLRHPAAPVRKFQIGSGRRPWPQDGDEYGLTRGAQEHALCPIGRRAPPETLKMGGGKGACATARAPSDGGPQRSRRPHRQRRSQRRRRCHGRRRCNGRRRSAGRWESHGLPRPASHADGLHSSERAPIGCVGASQGADEPGSPLGDPKLGHMSQSVDHGRDYAKVAEGVGEAKPNLAEPNAPTSRAIWLNPTQRWSSTPQLGPTRATLMRVLRATLGRHRRSRVKCSPTEPGCGIIRQAAR